MQFLLVSQSAFVDWFHSSSGGCWWFLFYNLNDSAVGGGFQGAKQVSVMFEYSKRATMRLQTFWLVIDKKRRYGRMFCWKVFKCKGFKYVTFRGTRVLHNLWTKQIYLTGRTVVPSIVFTHSEHSAMNSDLIITQCIAPSSCLISNFSIVSTCTTCSLPMTDLLPIGNSVDHKNTSCTTNHHHCDRQRSCHSDF